MAVQIDIWGCCVSRDIFSIGHSIDGFRSYEYNIRKFYQECSFISAFSDHISADITLDDLSQFKLTDFFKKCILADYNKTLLDTYCDSGADWLITDVRTLIYGAIELTSPNGEVEYCTDGGPMDSEAKYALLQKLNPDFKIRHATLNELDRYSALVKFTDLIKERYGKNIILIGVEEAYDYVSKNGVVKLRKSDGKLIQTERELFLEVLYLLDCHYVKYPFNCLADEHHKWGLSNVHYVSEYYDYALDCIDIIVTGKDVLHKLDRRYLEVVSLMDSIRNGERSSVGNSVRRLSAMVSSKKFESAFELSKELSGYGVPVASLHLGRAYLNGRGTQKDYAKAWFWLSKAVREYELFEGAADLFNCAWKRKDEDNYETVFDYVLANAEEGDIRCMRCVGKAYRYGKGVKADTDVAEKWFEESYEKGMKESLQDLFGLWWSADDKDSDRKLWNRASVMNDPVAKLYLGMMFRDGRYVGKDLSRAREYFVEASEEGNKEAATALADLSGKSSN